MDVAEQALQALEMLSRRHSKAILQAVSHPHQNVIVPVAKKKNYKILNSLSY